MPRYILLTHCGLQWLGYVGVFVYMRGHIVSRNSRLEWTETHSCAFPWAPGRLGPVEGCFRAPTGPGGEGDLVLMTPDPVHILSLAHQRGVVRGKSCYMVGEPLTHVKSRWLDIVVNLMRQGTDREKQPSYTSLRVA
ncbi:hypothetical protein DPEC_G00196030 [Dallia pectoralis]|uniref:Uncharacterized protein n=1 Tax=Dallia pectoralis TaxID=75939 RepID=A0ACC2G781_DALPE|nr:hypothetical protein DPEC_G00196030 [Dallia pectoralis]